MGMNLQELDDVASTKDTVGDGEFGGVGGREIRSKDTFFSTSTPKDFAGSTRTCYNLWGDGGSGGGIRGRL